MALHHAKPGEVIDLRPLGNRLKDAKSAAIVKAERFEAIRLIVPAGTEVPSHEVEGDVTLYCLEGRVTLGRETATVELGAGEWVYLKGGEAHSVTGLDDSSVLLTIIFTE